MHEGPLEQMLRQCRSIGLGPKGRISGLPMEIRLFGYVSQQATDFILFRIPKTGVYRLFKKESLDAARVPTTVW